MTNAFIIGSAVGAIVGLLHASMIYVHRTRESSRRLFDHPIAVRANAAYYALWTFSLWVLFGSYVLYLWVISIVVYAVVGAWRWCSRLMVHR